MSYHKPLRLSHKLYRPRLRTKCDVISDCWNKTQSSKSRSTSSFSIIILICTLCIPLILVTNIIIYQDPTSQPGRIKISTVKYSKTLFEHPDLTKIIDVPTYETLNLFHNEIKSNTIAVHYNIRGVQHSYLGIVVVPTAYALLSNTTFLHTIHQGNHIIPVVATCHAQDKLKFQYNENIWVFHETQGVERSLIQQLVLSIEARYIMDMRNRITGQFHSNLFMLIQYLIVKYGRISPI